MSQYTRSLNENIVTFSAYSVYLCFQTRAYDYLNIFFRLQCYDKASDSVCEHLHTYINITDKPRIHISYVYLSKEKKVEAIWIASRRRVSSPLLGILYFMLKSETQTQNTIVNKLSHFSQRKRYRNTKHCSIFI